MHDIFPPAPQQAETPAAAATEPSHPRARFLVAFQASLTEQRFAKLVLARPRSAEPGLERVVVRPVTLKDGECLSFVYSHATRDVTRNLPMAEGLVALDSLMADTFSHAHLLTTSGDWELRVSKKGKSTLMRGRQLAVRPDAGQHDRSKRRWVDPDRPFLQALGVMDAQHRLVPAMSRKWRQINKFVEVFDAALKTSRRLDAAPGTPLNVVDFGCGKGYLTFAVHDHLHQGLRLDSAQVTGVELRQDLVDTCQDVVGRLSLDGLAFIAGDVRTYAPSLIDVVIALHACDTATDHAIHLGVRAGASIILCSPCCHKQIRPQLLSPHPLQPILQHGIHLGQQAEMLTDGLRALLLEAVGYDTQVFEFVSLEHTQKNKMILAVKRPQAGSVNTTLSQVGDIKTFYGIQNHCLEQLLRADGLLPADT